MAELKRSQFAIYIAVQPAKGVAATTGFTKHLWNGDGGVIADVNRETVHFGDGRRWSDGFQFVATRSGGGEATLYGSAASLGRLWAYHFGEDAVSGTGPFVHTTHPSETGEPPWLTIITTKGRGADAERRLFIDCKLATIDQGSSTGDRVLEARCTFVSGGAAGRFVAAEPVAPLVEDDPFIHTDAEGQFELADLGVVAATSGLRIISSLNMEPYFGDSTTAHDLSEGRAELRIEGTMRAETQTLAFLNRSDFGTATPVDGQDMTDDNYFAAVSVAYTKGVGAGLREWSFAADKLEWAVADRPEVSPDGGAAEIGFAAILRVPATGELATVATTTGDADDYLA